MTLTPQDAASLEFDRIQEVWIAQTYTERQLEDSLPLEVQALGSGSWRRQQEAYYYIASRGEEYLPALARGARATILDVRRLSAGLIDRLFLCRHCKGTGRCPACNDGKVDLGCSCDSSFSCPVCKGGRDLRYKASASSFDVLGNRIENLEPRVLFPKRGAP